MSDHLAAPYLLTLLGAVCLLVSVEACMETAVQHVRMPASHIIASETVRPGGGGCRCCQLCRRHPRCSSYSVNAASGRCELYNWAGTYATVMVDFSRQWRYRIMPGHSGWHEFCRHDSDCQGGTCRGRVCTYLSSVTCREIFHTFGYGAWKTGSGRRRPEMDSVIGWLNGREIPLICRGQDTLLLSFTPNHPLDESTLMHKEVSRKELARSWDWSDRDSYSLLSHADDLIKANSANAHGYSMEMRCSFNKTGVARYAVVEMTRIPRDEPAVASSPRPGVGDISISTNLDGWLRPNFTLPYRPAAGPILLTINADDPTSSLGALVRRDGADVIWAGQQMTRLFISLR